MGGSCCMKIIKILLLLFLVLPHSQAQASGYARRFLKNYKWIKVQPGYFKYSIPVLTLQEPLFLEKNIDITSAFQIGKYEISNKEWSLCHAAGYCKKVAQLKEGESAEHPLARVNWHDAFQFTSWLSEETGESYRLPTEAEWLYAVFEGKDHLQNGRAPLAKRRIAPQKITLKRGSYGENAWGVNDYFGNIWEWTLTCWHASVENLLKERSPQELNSPDACTIRIVQGQDRAHISDIITDTYNGGCGALQPMSNLGFRILKDSLKENK